MRRSLVTCVKSAATTARSPAPGTLAPADGILPPLVLYRRLLRVHRKLLPPEMRFMGDEYVKAEFRRTRNTDNAIHIMGFLGEWKKYLDHHEKMLTEQQHHELGQRLDAALLDTLSPEQIGQLYELLQASKDVYEPMTPEQEAKYQAALNKVKQA